MKEGREEGGGKEGEVEEEKQEKRGGRETGEGVWRCSTALSHWMSVCAHREESDLSLNSLWSGSVSLGVRMRWGRGLRGGVIEEELSPLVWFRMSRAAVEPSQNSNAADP